MHREAQFQHLGIGEPRIGHMSLNHAGTWEAWSRARAADDRGFNMQPSGTTISRGFRQPAFKGISSSTRVRKTYSTAATVIARGALKLLGSCALVPVKSIRAPRFAVSTRAATRMLAPLSNGSENSPSCSTSLRV